METVKILLGAAIIIMDMIIIIQILKKWKKGKK